MPHNRKTLDSFHHEIAQWRAQGISLRAIAEKLKNEGVDTDFNQVGRYCKKKSLPPSPPARPVEAAPPESATPTPTNGTAPGRLFAEPASNHPPTVSPPSAPRANSANSQYSCGVHAGNTKPAPHTPSPAVPAFKIVSAADCPLPVPPVVHDHMVIELPKAQRVAQPASVQKPQAVKTAVPPPLPSPVPAPSHSWSPPPPLYVPLAGGAHWTPDLALVGFGQDDEEWQLADACEGTFIMGATGSGKTTGSARTIAMSFLQCGFGGLVLTVKREERARWERYAAQTGRTAQLCIVEPRGRFRFNFLDYEARRPAVGAGLVENLASLFYTVMDVHAHGSGDAELQSFWTNAGKELLRNTFRVLLLSQYQISLDLMCRLIAESPSNLGEAEALDDPNRAFFHTALQRAWKAVEGKPEQHVMETARRYWLQWFPRLAADTRSCVVTAFSAMADGFMEPAIHELLCKDTTVIPEDTMKGAIILVDLSLKQFDAVGLFAQSIWKYVFQKAIERRTDPDDASRRPVFLWIDEAQYFLSNYDGLFQSTARSSRCTAVYIAQNIPLLYGMKGGAHSKENIDGFLGNLNTKIFHCNNDPTSNHWAATQIGQYKDWQFNFGGGNSVNSGGVFEQDKTSRGSNFGMTEAYQFEVQPSDFLTLRTGGRRHQGLVDAILVKGGTVFASTGKCYLRTVFQQELCV